MTSISGISYPIYKDCKRKFEADETQTENKRACTEEEISRLANRLMNLNFSVNNESEIENNQSSPRHGNLDYESVCDQEITTIHGSGKYTGLISNDRPEEYGVIHFDGGGTYSGGWKEGKFHGDGVIDDKENGIKYIGGFSEGAYYGPGIIQFDRNTFKGFFEGPNASSYGILQKSNGITVIGNGKWYRYTKLSGDGHLKKANATYTGQFEKGKFHGKGKFEITNQGRYKYFSYEGEFVRGKYEGQGKAYGIYTNNLTAEKSGRWKAKELIEGEVTLSINDMSYVYLINDGRASHGIFYDSLGREEQMLIQDALQLMGIATS